MSVIRNCTKAGSWYPFKSQLVKSLKKWLSNVNDVVPQGMKCKALIGPHAGLSYCGQTSAHAYGQVASVNEIERVFVLGPTHYEHVNGCALSSANICKTPARDLPVDGEVIKKLGKTGIYRNFTLRKEEQEHSLELHFPFIAHCFSKNVKIVPIIVGELDEQSCKKYAETLLPYFSQPENFFVVSSDFCHWGRRFGYTYHDKSFSKPWESIEDLDKKGVSAICSKNPANWNGYIKKYNNSVCGKKPIWLLMHLVKLSEDFEDFEFKMTGYSQSNKAKSFNDSSVSYASVVLLKK